MPDHSVLVAPLRAVTHAPVNPLILRFPTPNPVYPTALTATGGHRTEILIYLASDTAMTTDAPLTLRFRGNMRARHLNMSYLESIEPTEFLEGEKSEYLYLSKFKSTLSPVQMEQDIEFRPDPTGQPFREHVYRW